MEVLGILVSLILLMYFAYRGFSVIYLAPILALMAAVSQGLSPMPAYTELFMGKAVGFIKVYLPIFVLGAVFGKVMEDSGMAKSIAQVVAQKFGEKYIIPAIVLTGAFVTYGGMNGLVAGFAVYPVAADLFRKANWPKRFIPATMFLGFGTATMDCFPGTLQHINIIATSYWGTTVYAAPVIGTLGGVLILGIGMLLLNHNIKIALAKGEGYGTGHTNETELSDDMEVPHWTLAILPLITVIVLNFILTMVIKWDPHILDPFIAMKLPLVSQSVKSILAVWALTIAEVVAIIMVLIIGRNNLSQSGFAKSMNAGAIGSLLAIINVASEVGYGNVISALPGFKAVANFLLSINIGDSPLMSEAITITTLAGMSGSAAGGMVISLEIMGKSWLAMANQIGMSPEILHRIGCMAAGGMDTLPHNGGIITLLGICGLTHRQSYPAIFQLTLIKTAMAFVMMAVAVITGLV
ncbi:GntP family permease [Sporomusa malonica]|uniref:Gluconate permease GntT n=1 Tax=Sporomusa malonica TaxID=112901 RepID=A0A1W2F779_9FIRM|nr:GntP family permease [Sporomusa malonica]SMD17448.1 gluconate permease GntT [Sporomusa malonica]